MKVTKKNLAKLNRSYKGYLRGDRVDRLFEDFGIGFAAGHWCAGDFADRFAPVGYMSDKKNFDSGVIAQIERVAKAGIKGIEFHEVVFIDENYKVVPETVKVVKKVLRQHGLVPTNMNTNLWTDPKWKLGGVTNPDPKTRADALKVALQGIDVAKAVGCKSFALWPGSDGWDYNFEVNYGTQLAMFVDACKVLARKCRQKGLAFGVEAKPHEPREGNIIVATSQKVMLIAQQVNRALRARVMGCAIDYGHEQMYNYEPADNLYLARQMGVPVVNFHINTAKAHSNDEDRVTGTGDLWRMIDFCYAAIDTGYKGWFGEDQFTYRMEPVKAMSLSRELFANLMKKALMIYARRDKLLKAQATGDAGRTIDVVKEIILNG